MRSVVKSVVIPLAIFLAVTAYGDGWEIRRDDLNPERPPVENGVVTVNAGDENLKFPRYLTELGIKAIRIRFTESGAERRKLSVVWSGGSQGPDKFAVSVDGLPAGVSRTADSQRIPYAWHRDDFAVKLAPGPEHVVEIKSLPEFTSAIEFAGIRMSAPEAESYQPLCYGSIGSLEQYEKALGGKGAVVESAHLWVFAPHEYAAEAKALATFLEKAYAEMKAIYGMDTMFKFSVEHYPKGHERGWGGISGAGTIGYTTEALERFAKLGTSDVCGFAGYTEEMSHGFKGYYKCGGTYEALGVAVQEDIVRRLVPATVADAFWLREHKQWDDTHQAYLAAGRRNPDPEKYPWNVLYTRILNSLFLKLRTEYGDRMWADFFAMIRQMDYPLHRAKDTERLGTYADIFSAVFGRDMREEFTSFGIDLDADPPWGWETYGK